MSVDPVDWKNYDPVTGVGDPSTPITAENLKRYQAYIESQAGDAAQAAADAAQSAAEAGQQDDAAVVAILEQPATDTRQFLDGRYALAGEVPPGGVDPNDVGYDIIPLLGQSNMMGRGVLLNSDPPLPENPRVFTFPPKGLHANQIIQATDPLEHWGVTQAGSVGVGITFANYYLNTVNPNRRVLLVPAALGGTGFGVGVKRWDPAYTPERDNLYLLAVRQIRLALEAAGANSRIVGYLWHQGEGDAGSETYGDDLDNFIATLRAELDTPAAWFLIGQMSPAGNALSTAKQATNLVQLDTPRRVERTAFAYAAYGAHKPNDTTHFSAQGARILSRNYFTAMPLAVANQTGTLPIPPGRVTEFLGTPGALNVEWERPACRFTDFVVEHRLAGEDDWTEWSHTASLHNRAIIGGYDIGDDVEVRVATVNEEGTSDFGDVFTVTPTPWPSALLPGTPWRVYSLRRIDPTATSAIQVRRSSDNTTTDIGFTTAGELDEDALRTFCGAGDGFVSIWRGQLGTSSMVQPTAANQPKIVSAGVVLKDHGRPVMEFDGVDDYMYSTVPGSSTGPFTAHMVCRWDVAGGQENPRILSERNTGTANPMYTFWSGDGYGASQFRNDAGTMAQILASDDLWVTGDMQVLGAVDDQAAVAFYRDLRVMDPAARTRTGTITANRFTIGSLFGNGNNTNNAKVTFAEAMFWQSAVDVADLEGLVVNQRAYFTLV